MLNRFARLFFNSSILIPVGFIAGLIQIIRKNIFIGITICTVFVIIYAIHLIFIKYIINRLQSMKIEIININTESREGLFNLYISYIVSFIDIYIGKNYTVMFQVLIGLIIIIGSKKSINNIVLSALGYKVYSISTVQGIDFKLLTKREIRNKNNINKVIRLFDDLVMEV